MISNNNKHTEYNNKSNLTESAIESIHTLFFFQNHE